jgi:hypothetical protein
LLDTSARSPIEANAEIPMPRLSPCSSAAMPMPPLCEISATPPGSGRERANVALSAALATPRQFGPISRMPAERQ